MIEFVSYHTMVLSNFILQIYETEEGQDMIEYALLAALIAVVCIAVMIALGGGIQSVFNSVVSTLGTA